MIPINYFYYFSKHNIDNNILVVDDRESMTRIPYSLRFDGLEVINSSTGIKYEWSPTFNTWLDCLNIFNIMKKTPPKYLRPFGKWHMIKCPGCGLEARINQDQYEGKVSIDCPDCEFHDVYNFVKKEFKFNPN